MINDCVVEEDREQMRRFYNLDRLAEKLRTEKSVSGFPEGRYVRIVAPSCKRFKIVSIKGNTMICTVCLMDEGDTELTFTKR